MPTWVVISLYHAGNLAIDAKPNSGVTEYSYNVNIKLAKIKDAKAYETYLPPEGLIYSIPAL